MPDAYPIKLPKNMSVYSMEKFISTGINCNEVKEVITCGYPKLASNDLKTNITASPVINREKYCRGRLLSKNLFIRNLMLTIQ